MIVDLKKWEKIWNDDAAGVVDKENIYNVLMSETLARYKKGYEDGKTEFDENNILLQKMEYKHDAFCMRINEEYLVASLVYTFLSSIEYIGYLEGLEDR